jgi:hypothetical protein
MKVGILVLVSFTRSDYLFKAILVSQFSDFVKGLYEVYDGEHILTFLPGSVLSDQWKVMMGSGVFNSDGTSYIEVSYENSADQVVQGRPGSVSVN